MPRPAGLWWKFEMTPELRALKGERSPEKRVELLRQVSERYLEPVENRREAELYLLAEMIDRIVSSITRKQKLKLVPHADMHSVLARRLAVDPDAEVACPVICRSEHLTDDDLAHIGRTASQEHLYAIAGRATVSEAVSDILIDRGGTEVVQELTANAGARFSSEGLDQLIEKASRDMDLCRLLVDRPDLSQATVDRLLPLASAAVVVRMAERGFTIDGPMTVEVSNELRERFAAALRDRRRHVHATYDLIDAVGRGEITIDEAVWTLVTEERLVDVATLVGTSAGIDRTRLFSFIAQNKTPALLIVFRAVDMAWHTVEGVLRLIQKKRGSRLDIDRLRADYGAVDVATAQRSLRFFKARRAVEAAA